MPTHYIQKQATGKLVNIGDGTNLPGDVGSVGFDSTTEDFRWNSSGTTMRTVPKVIVVAKTIDANSVDGHVFIADDAYQIVKVSEIHSVVGSTSAAVDVKKCTGTTAPASGTSVFASTTFDLTATVNTTQSPALSATASTLKLAAGDKLAFDFSGTLTGLVGTVNIYLRRI